jgi:hypothetical protein
MITTSNIRINPPAGDDPSRPGGWFCAPAAGYAERYASGES